jgi:hypothetical protein
VIVLAAGAVVAPAVLAGAVDPATTSASGEGVGATILVPYVAVGGKSLNPSAYQVKVTTRPVRLPRWIEWRFGDRRRGPVVVTRRTFSRRIVCPKQKPCGLIVQTQIWMTDAGTLARGRIIVTVTPDY